MIRTFRAERHIDSVECVTFQVPQSHSFEGETNGSFEVVEALEESPRYLEGARRLTVLADAAPFGAGAAGAGAGAGAGAAVTMSSAIVCGADKWWMK